MIVWILQDDDNVIGVYTTEDLANEARKRLGASYSPYSCETDQPMPELINDEYGWCIHIDQSGSACLVVNVDATVLRRRITENRQSCMKTSSRDRFVLWCMAKTENDAVNLAKNLAAESGWIKWANIPLVNS